MMNKLSALWAAAVAAVTAYPHGLAIVLNVAVILAARFGLHVTVTELVAIAIASHAGLATFTRSATIPKTNLTGK